MRKHVQVLGILNIVWGSIGVFGALIIMLVFGGVVSLIGVTAHHDPDARIAIPIVGLIGGAIFLLIMITSIPSIVAGAGLLRMAPWSRILTIVLSALHLFSIPFGTALGIYGLWVLLSDETVSLFVPSEGPIRI
jgi:hypothetical protein